MLARYGKGVSERIGDGLAGLDGLGCAGIWLTTALAVKGAGEGRDTRQSRECGEDAR